MVVVLVALALVRTHALSTSAASRSSQRTSRGGECKKVDSVLGAIHVFRIVRACIAHRLLDSVERLGWECGRGSGGVNRTAASEAICGNVGFALQRWQQRSGGEPAAIEDVLVVVTLSPQQQQQQQLVSARSLD